MILFSSKNRSNVYKARDIKKWQCTTQPHQIKEGDPVFIKVNDEEKIEFLGVLDKITKEPLEDWPIQEEEARETEVPTIYFREISMNDFQNRQGSFRYRKSEIINE